jgi:hypothetical protein
MHQMPRLSIMIWISTGTWIWGEGFLGLILSTLRRADVLFAGVDPLAGLDDDEAAALYRATADEAIAAYGGEKP